MADAHEWAKLLLERDSVQGRKVLERMIEFYEENDGKADDMGRLFIVIDAMQALGREPWPHSKHFAKPDGGDRTISS